MQIHPGSLLVQRMKIPAIIMLQNWTIPGMLSGKQKILTPVVFQVFPTLSMMDRGMWSVSIPIKKQPANILLPL